MTETHQFQAEITQLMNLIINTFYSNKEIFLRELVSNASDALDKVRFESMKNESNNWSKDYKIQIKTDKENKILTIQDTGIGMTKEDLINNLGTIAKSGTKGFMENLESTQDMSLIGQFGVGFYSAYLVANTVKVISKHEEDKQYIWESNAGGTFSVTECEEQSDIRGTRIELYLKDDQLEYLEEERIKSLIKKHNQYIGYPIELWVEKTRQEEVEEVEESKEEDTNEPQENNEAQENNEGEVEVEEVDENEDKKEDEKKTVEVKYNEWEKINCDAPIWSKNPNDVSEEEYKSFYKNLSNDWEDYLINKHFSVEGNLEYKCLLFIPKRKPFDIFDPHKKKDNIKLHVRRIFITDNCEELIPDWLSFVKGIVDSEDLPLNVSREMLQHNNILKVMKKNITKKAIEMMEDIAEDEEKYKGFYENYSKNMKLGLYEDSNNRAKISKLLRYYTNKNPDTLQSLDTYVSNMKEDQKEIYYITGENKESVMDSPFVEKLNKNGLEVLFMVDAIDEYTLQQFKEYDGKKLVSVTKDGLKLDDDVDIKDYETLCKKVKEHIGDKIEKVQISTRIVDSPSCLVTSEFGWSANMERIMKAQALGDDNSRSYMMSKKTLELNKDHKIVKELKRRLDQDENDNTIKDLATLLYDVSLLRSGFTMEDTKQFSNRICRMIELGLNLDDDVEPVNEEEQNETVEETVMEQID